MGRPGYRVAWVLVAVCAVCAFALDPLAEARRLKQAGDLAGAERVLQPVVAADPDSLAAQHLLAWVRIGEGRTADAVEPLRAVVRLAPDSPEADLARQALVRLGQSAARRTDDVAPPPAPGEPAAAASGAAPAPPSTRSQRILVGLLALAGLIAYLALSFTSLTSLRHLTAVVAIGLVWWLEVSWLRLDPSGVAACFWLLVLPVLAGSEARQACLALPLSRFEPRPEPPSSSSGSVVGKCCGHCGKPVPLSSQAGGRCPHCGVHWGSENSRVATREPLTPERRRRQFADGMACLAWLGTGVLGLVVFGSSLGS